jgi:ABC-type Fe3+ transport system substrate-binding protein
MTLKLPLVCGILALLALLLPSCNKSEDPSLPELIIVSPHGSDIRREFSDAFSDWHQKKYGTRVNVRWPDVGGTGNVIKDLEGAYRAGKAPSYDLAFGGGSATFEFFRQRGFLARPDIPDATLHEVPPDIFGAPLHGQGDTWIAATMSNFGIVYNKDRIRELGLKTPRVWEDLAQPEWFGRISLADPSKSGSVRSSYDQIFLQYGWEKGWNILVRMFANTESLREGGSAPADDVGSAQAVAGVAIDFYGRKAVIRAGESLVGFMIPEGGSITDADPIAMLKGAPHPELAAHFIEFVISEEGQKLWTFRANTGKGGPHHYVLGRLAVRPEMYEKYKAEMFDATNPFANAQPLKANERETIQRSAFIGELIKAALIDNRAALLEARRAIHNAGDPADLLARLEAVPTFIPTHVEGGQLIDDPEKPVTNDQQAALAAEFKPRAPKKDDPQKAAKEVKAANTARLQTRLIDHWRTEFATRFQTLQSEARSRHK